MNEYFKLAGITTLESAHIPDHLALFMEGGAIVGIYNIKTGVIHGKSSATMLISNATFDRLAKEAKKGSVVDIVDLKSCR